MAKQQERKLKLTIKIESEDNIMKKIVRNRIKCKKCGEIIESTSRHDFKFCKCGAVAVDGGKDYLRRVGSKEDYEELVEYEGSDDDEE